MILILNQFPEHDPAPTSRYLKEWGSALRQQGKPLQWISSSPSYRHSSGPFLARVFRDLFTLSELLFKGLFAKKPHLIIASSSPPGILVIATLLKFWHRAPLLHWAMDLHPDLTFALGEKTPFRNLLKYLVARCYTSCEQVFTLDESMRRHLLQTYQTQATITPLWALHIITKTPCALLSPPRWIYSGNLGKAHVWKTLLEVQLELEKINSPFILRLQGNAWKRLPLAIKKPLQLELADYTSDDNLVELLLSCHILIATQNPCTAGLLWPCKLALLSILPRPLLWVGSPQSSISRSLRNRPHTGVFEPNEVLKIVEWIQRYSTPPDEQDFRQWIESQPTKAAFLEQAEKAISLLTK